MERPLTFSERVMKRFEMARLPRRQRNERIAIMTMLVLAALYFVLRPIIEALFPSGPGEPSTPSEPSAPAQAPGKKTDRPVRPDRRGG